MATTQDAMTNEEKIFEYLAATDPMFKEAPEAEQETQSDEEEQPVAEIEEESESEDTEVEVDESEEEESSERWMPSSLDELAAAMEVDTDDLKSIRVKTKVDGIEGEATLADVIKNYQFDKSLTGRSEAFAEERKKFEAQSAALNQEYQKKVQDAEALIQVIEEQLQSEIGHVDWDQLRVDNPAEWTARRQEYVERIGQIEQAKLQVMESREEDFKKQQQEYMKRHEAILAENSRKLLEAWPELNDTKVREKELGDVKSYLRSQGVSDQEMNMISDYRVILLAKKAKQFDEMETKAQPAKAKAKTKPKFTKPGSATTKQNASDAAVKKRYTKATKTQNVDDWAKILEDRI